MCKDTHDAHAGGSEYYVVRNEEAMGFISASHPKSMVILAEALPEVRRRPVRAIPIQAGKAKLRLATVEDFHAFGLIPPRTGALPRPNPTPIVCKSMSVGLDDFIATDEQRQTADLAVASFGYLVKSVAFKRMTFAEFADAIERVYDTTEGRTAFITKTLRALNRINAFVGCDREVLALDAYEALKAADSDFRSELVRVYGHTDADAARYNVGHADAAVTLAARAYYQASDTFFQAQRSARAVAAH